MDACVVRSDKQMLQWLMLLLLSRPPLKHGVLRREHATYRRRTRQTYLLSANIDGRCQATHRPVLTPGRPAGYRGFLRDSERSRLFDGYIPVGSHKSFPSLHRRGVVRSSSRSTQTLPSLNVAGKKFSTATQRC